MATFVLTVIGDDRPGLVSDVSARISAHGASWERSQMSRLAGKFAGIVLVDVANDRLDPLISDLSFVENGPAATREPASGVLVETSRAGASYSPDKTGTYPAL